MSALFVQKNEAEHIPPINTLPNELLCMIFDICMFESHDVPAMHNFANPLPWAITWTCRRWRDVAIRTQSLWNRLRFSGLTNGGHHLAQICLERSGNAPLDVAVHEHIQSTIFTELKRNTDRIQHLFVCCGADFDQLQNIADSPMPMLDGLALDIAYAPKAKGLVPILGHCPNIRYLSLYAEDQELSDQVFVTELTWTHLVRLELLVSCTADKLLEALSGCAVLEDLLIVQHEMNTTGAHEPISRVEPVNLPSLISLSIGHSHPDLFTTLRCPNIYSLTLHDTDQEIIKKLMVESQCRPTVLELGRGWHPGDDGGLFAWYDSEFDPLHESVKSLVIMLSESINMEFLLKGRRYSPFTHLENLDIVSHAYYEAPKPFETLQWDAIAEILNERICEDGITSMNRINITDDPDYYSNISDDTWDYLVAIGSRAPGVISISARLRDRRWEAREFREEAPFHYMDYGTLFMNEGLEWQDPRAVVEEVPFIAAPAMHNYQIPGALEGLDAPEDPPGSADCIVC